MAKKTFKDTTANIDRFFSDANTDVFTDKNENQTAETQKPQRTHDTQKTHTISKTYRINLKLDGSHEEFLKAVSWRKNISITQYINELIQADKEKIGDEVISLYKDTLGI